jgi:hypothetical protein
MDGNNRTRTEALPENAETTVEPVFLANRILTLCMEALSQEISIQGVSN